MRRATILFSFAGKDPKIYDKYAPFFVKGFYSSRDPLSMPLEPDSEALHEAIRDICRTADDAYYHLMSRTEYTRKELAAIPFFQLDVGFPLELEGTDPSDYGTKYTGGCPVCGLGRKLAGDVFVDRKFIRKYRIGELQPDYFVSEEIRRLIEEAGLTGVSFEREVRDYKGRELPHRFYVMNIHHTLPPLSTSTWLEDTKKRHMVSSCGHGTIYLRSDLQYERKKLEGAMDFNLTAEILNNDQIPALVVSAKTRKVFREHKGGWARYTPVLLTDGVVGTNPYLDPPLGLG